MMPRSDLAGAGEILTYFLKPFIVILGELDRVVEIGLTLKGFCQHCPGLNCNLGRQSFNFIKNSIVPFQLDLPASEFGGPHPGCFETVLFTQIEGGKGLPQA